MRKKTSDTQNDDHSTSWDLMWEDSLSAPIEKDIDKLQKQLKNAASDTDKNLKKESLVGKFLVFIGQTDDPMFDKAVVYVTEVGDNGTVRGVIINKLMFGSAAIECKTGENMPSKMKEIYADLYQGGPENQAHGFVLFPTKDNKINDPFSTVLGDVSVSTSFGVLQDILDGEGPARKLIAMGHCLWKRGELEWEIYNNKWLVTPGRLDILFDTSLEQRWEKAREASNLDLTTFIHQSGLA
jgi:putative transcriptional regulator